MYESIKNKHEFEFRIDEEEAMSTMAVDLGIRSLKDEDKYEAVIRAGLNALKEDLTGKKSLYF